MEPGDSGIEFICEHCKKQFRYEFIVPIAVRCSHCDSIFDARLQILKKAKAASDAGE